MTTYIPERTHAILRELRYGPTGVSQIADAIFSSAFVVRADLKAMKRELLAWSDENGRWRLSDKGWRVVAAADQISLGLNEEIS